MKTNQEKPQTFAIKADNPYLLKAIWEELKGMGYKTSDNQFSCNKDVDELWNKSYIVINENRISDLNLFRVIISACDNSKDKIFHLPEDYQTALDFAKEQINHPYWSRHEIKEGDWVKVINGGRGAFGANDFVGIVCNKPKALSLNYGGESKRATAPLYVYLDKESWGLCKGYEVEKLSEEERIEYLVKEAEVKYPKGTKFVNAGSTGGIFTSTGEAVTWTSHSYPDGIGNQDSEGMRGEGLFFADGQWAEIIEDHPNITINGYKGEFFDEYVKFGCAKIHKQVFIKLYETLNLLSTSVSNVEVNRGIESVTIGKGTFTTDQIKEIAEYYIK